MNSKGGVGGKENCRRESGGCAISINRHSACWSSDIERRSHDFAGPTNYVALQSCRSVGANCRVDSQKCSEHDWAVNTMCGIAGIRGFRDRVRITLQIEKMKEALKHRGPDGEGSYIAEDKALGLGHRRLSIIDLTRQAAQPMISSDGRYVITYNGEIYNYKELKEKCIEKGSIFKSQSDTEVILEVYRHWGEKCFTLFSGMWALALYDTEEEKLILSRDPFGIKPLYYGYLDNVLFFASEPKALTAADERFREVDDITVRLFEDYGYVDRGDWTFYRNIKRFPHAHFAVLDLNSNSTQLLFRRYWAPPGKTLKIGVGEASAELRRLLCKSVAMHLRSDVPVGACLSGGLDSSAIVCIGASLLPSGSRFNTFTTLYPEHPEIDETNWAKKVIHYTGSFARFAEPDLRFFLDDFTKVVRAQDEPFGSTSIFAQYAIFKKIGSTEVKVVLDGQGADEQLGGYHGFFRSYLDSLLASKRLWAYISEGFSLKKRHGFPFSMKLRDFSAVLKDKKSFLNQDGGAPGDVSLDELEARLCCLALPERNFEEVLVNLTVETNLPQLLRYEDRNSMAFSVESRVPFLEPELVAFALSLPADMKIHKGITKHVLREALRGLVPDEILLRNDKMGFPAPEKKWLKQGLGIDVEGPGQKEWRKLAVSMWRAHSAPQGNLC